MTSAPIRVAGHLGELLQGRLGPEGPVALISLPCPVLAVTAGAEPGDGLALDAATARLISRARARRFLGALGLDLSGKVSLHAEMPVGGGAGSSTAALVALARLAGWQGAPAVLAAACLASEGATDPLMFPAPERLLWASRQARVLRDLPPLPRCEVLASFWGKGGRTGAADQDFPDIADLVERWDDAARGGDLATLAALAAQSAERTLALRHPGPDPTADLARRLGALGHVVAHTGSARGLIFAPGAVPDSGAAALEQAGLRGVICFQAGGPGE